MIRPAAVLGFIFALLFAMSPGSPGAEARSEDGPVRFATFNASLNRNALGQLVQELSQPGSAQPNTIAEIIQRTRPHVLLINEFDFDEKGEAARLFQDNYLSISHNGSQPILYPYRFVAPSNTGVPSGFDLNNNGRLGEPDDALGFGAFPGQFGMAIFSQYPIVSQQVRTFQKFLWKDMPGALLPDDPATPAPNDWYSAEELKIFRLSSKSHWDVPIRLGHRTVHVLASHPTPPVFDGPEDRNGTRNHDEIRFFADYISNARYIYDDSGRRGGLQPGSAFVIMGDQNSDPLDGDSIPGSAQLLLEHSRVDSSHTPSSLGAVEASRKQGGANLTHKNDPKFDTADFADSAPGNLRADYVLPSRWLLRIVGSGVFWPVSTDPLFRLVGVFPFPSSDHRLVWVDVDVAGFEATPIFSNSCAPGVDFVAFSDALNKTQFQGTPVGGLSAIAYDKTRQRYLLQPDRNGNVPSHYLTLNLGFNSRGINTVQIEKLTQLLMENGTPFTGQNFDGEGIAPEGRRVWVSSEGGSGPTPQEPTIRAFGLDGKLLQSLDVPAKFIVGTGGGRPNLTFESLTLSPDGDKLFTANEGHLTQDGQTADFRSRMRILEYRQQGNSFKPGKEYFYLTDPGRTAGDLGVVEVLALSKERLLVMERGFVAGRGNTVRVYLVDLDDARDVSNIASLSAAGLRPVQKKLLFDLNFCPPSGATKFGDQSNPLLDNFEGMTLGPRLNDGRRSLVIISDDNNNPAQVTRIIVLSVAEKLIDGDDNRRDDD
jgi:3-phytase/alkaline phosphatase D